MAMAGLGLLELVLHPDALKCELGTGNVLVSGFHGEGAEVHVEVLRDQIHSITEHGYRVDGADVEALVRDEVPADVNARMLPGLTM